MKTIRIRNVPKEDARNEIIDYMKKHKKSYGSDISHNLGLDLDMVFSIMKGLEAEGIVEQIL